MAPSLSPWNSLDHHIRRHRSISTISPVNTASTQLERQTVDIDPNICGMTGGRLAFLLFLVVGQVPFFSNRLAWVCLFFLWALDVFSSWWLRYSVFLLQYVATSQEPISRDSCQSCHAPIFLDRFGHINSTHLGCFCPGCFEEKVEKQGQEDAKLWEQMPLGHRIIGLGHGTGGHPKNRTGEFQTQ